MLCNINRSKRFKNKNINNNYDCNNKTENRARQIIQGTIANAANVKMCKRFLALDCETQSLDIFGLTDFKNIRVRTERFRRFAIFFNKIFVELLLAVFMTLQLLYNDLPEATASMFLNECFLIRSLSRQGTSRYSRINFQHHFPSR